ncbi:MAG: BrnT family toxin [Rhodospirillaceae bacterium]|nr:BrnT family toxin [Rhodospirillaceae bacterium]
MKFAWDQAKNQANRAKHGIALERAAEMFEAPTDERVDRRKNYGETRMICFGVIEDRVYCCVYTDRGDTRRIISLRKANADETETYLNRVE